MTQPDNIKKIVKFYWKISKYLGEEETFTLTKCMMMKQNEKEMKIFTATQNKNEKNEIKKLCISRLERRFHFIENPFFITLYDGFFSLFLSEWETRDIMAVALK